MKRYMYEIFQDPGLRRWNICETVRVWNIPGLRRWNICLFRDSPVWLVIRGRPYLFSSTYSQGNATNIAYLFSSTHSKGNATTLLPLLLKCYDDRPRLRYSAIAWLLPRRTPVIARDAVWCVLSLVELQSLARDAVLCVYKGVALLHLIIHRTSDS